MLPENPILLPLAALGSALTATLSSFSAHDAAIFASSVATIFAAVASVLRGRARRKNQLRTARKRRPSAPEFPGLGTK